MDIFISLFGLVALLALGLLLSRDRRAINWRTVGGAFALQFGLGALVLYSDSGRAALAKLSSGVAAVIQFGNQGINFIFGDLAGKNGFVFGIHVLGLIVFFSSLIAVLYHLGVMQWLVRLIGGGLARLLGTSKGESLAAASNIFVGLSEAPLVIKPYVAGMTRSELFAVMVGGLASVAGSVIGGYAQMGVSLDYLLTASFMAAPGGLLFAKLLYPEIEVPTNYDEKRGFSDGEQPSSNVIDAAAGGAITGLHMALNVGAIVLCFVGFVALFNGLVGTVGNWFGIEALSLEKLLGYGFAPVAWLLGTPWAEAPTVGALLGQKLVANEFVAYMSFTQHLQDASAIALSAKTQAIISFALCGFANFGSIAILVGGLAVIAPQRRAEVAKLGPLALLAGTLANLMSACLAGLFLSLA